MTRPSRSKLPPRGREPAGWSRFYAVVRRIPRGRVATYGQIAALAGRPGHARQAGYALHALGEHTTVPWHRVINAQGRLSLMRRGPGAGFEQRFRLEREGIEFDARGRVPLARYGWRRPRSRRRQPSRRELQARRA